MSESAYPLSWPVGWKRTEDYRRKRADFRTGRRDYETHTYPRALTVADGTDRVIAELKRFGVADGLGVRGHLHRAPARSAALDMGIAQMTVAEIIAALQKIAPTFDVVMRSSSGRWDQLASVHVDEYADALVVLEADR